MERQFTVSDICEIRARFDDCDTEEFLASFDKFFANLIHPIETLTEVSKISMASSNSSITSRAAVAGFCRLLPRAAEFPSITKDLNALKVHRLVQALIQCPSWFDQWGLLGVNACLTHFRDGCKKNFSKTIVPFASRCLNSSNEMVRKRAAYCVALFPMMAGNTTRQGVWNQQINGVLLNLHGTIVKLAEPFPHDDSCQLPVPLKAKKKSTNGGDAIIFFNQLFENDGKTMATESLESRADFLLDVLRLMYSEFEDYVVLVDLQQFVDLLFCLVGLVERLNKSKPTFYYLTAKLATFVGEKLLPMVGTLGAPFSSSFVDGAMRLLDHCRLGPYNIVESAYVLLAAAAKHIGPASLITFERMTSRTLDYTDHLLQYSSTASASTEASKEASTGSTKRKAQKRKAILMEEMSSDQFVFSGPSEAQRNATMACFRMWVSVLESGGGCMKSNDFRRLQQTICRLLVQVQTETRNAAKWSLNDRKCRRELYNVLAGLVACPHPSRPSALQCAIRIFENGFRRESDPTVVAACGTGLSICALMAKPRVPCLESVLVEDGKNTETPAEKISSRSGGGSNWESKSDVEMVKTPLVEETVFAAAIPEEERKAAPAAKPARELSDEAARRRLSDGNKAPEIVNIDEDDDDHGSERADEPEEGIETVTVEDDDHDKIACVEKSETSENKDENSGEKADAGCEQNKKELHSMLADFVDEPAEGVDVYID